jgi:transposase InsO family protein
MEHQHAARDWRAVNDERAESIEARLALVESLDEDEVTEAEKRVLRQEYMARYGVTERTIRNYLARYRTTGIMGFYPDAGEPQSPRIRNEALARRVIELVTEKPRRTVPMIRKLLGNEDAFKDEIVKISDRTIYRFLGEHQYTMKQRWALANDLAGRISFRRFEAEESLLLVQGDGRDGIWLPDPGRPKGQRKTYLFAWIDDFSRKVLHAQYYFDEKLPRMEDTFKRMVLRWGIPKKLYLDNGSVYIAKQFAWILAQLGIKKIHHKPYQSYCKGKIEAMNKTILNEFQREASCAGFVTLEELNSALWAWIETDYNVRIHSSTGETPNDRFTKGLPHEHRRITDIAWFEALFLMRETRSVTKYGIIKLHANEYRVKAIPHGLSVEVRFDPFDLSRIHVYRNGVCVETVAVNRLKNTVASHIPEERPTSAQTVAESSRKWFETLRAKHLKDLREATTTIPYAKLDQGIKTTEDPT